MHDIPWRMRRRKPEKNSKTLTKNCLHGKHDQHTKNYRSLSCFSSFFLFLAKEKNVAREKLLRKFFSEKFCCWARWSLSLDVYIKHEIFRLFTRSCKVSINLRIPSAASHNTTSFSCYSYFFASSCLSLATKTSPATLGDGLNESQVDSKTRLDVELSCKIAAAAAWSVLSVREGKQFERVYILIVGCCH